MLRESCLKLHYDNHKKLTNNQKRFTCLSLSFCSCADLPCRRILFNDEHLKKKKITIWRNESLDPKQLKERWVDQSKYESTLTSEWDYEPSPDTSLDKLTLSSLLFPLPLRQYYTCVWTGLLPFQNGSVPCPGGFAAGMRRLALWSGRHSRNRR